MQIYKDILMEVLAKEDSKITFGNLKMVSPCELVEFSALTAISKIHQALDNPQLDDFECIEEIVCILEELGVGGGSRHDF